MFKELDATPNFPKYEKEVIKFWQELDIVEVLKKLREDSPKKVYYDGPITANGTPHYAHAITWTLKDLIPRYWSMQGYYVARNMGWDCQGIPVEYEVEKELGLTKKEDIEKTIGVAKFNELCRQAVLKYRDVMFEYETRLGRWFDKSEIYATMDAPFIESAWWSLKELYKKGLLYEGYKVVAYSTRAGTSLSTHEVTDGGYKDVEDPYITVKFPVKNSSGEYFLAWTTTPWTMPGNLMLAVNKDLDYVKVAAGGEVYIVAAALVEALFKDLEHKVISTMRGQELAGIEYEPPFNYFAAKRAEGCFKVILSSHATATDGTGIVHLAPYGEEDFEILTALGITMFDYLDDTANFTAQISDYQGQFYQDANPKIVEDLRANSRLFNTGKIIHRMPICWRTKTPLIYKPIKSWYVAVNKLKTRMLAENQKTNWSPADIKDGQSKMWLSGARDWALSRNRYWGTPLPLWVNDQTGEKVFVGSFQELKELSGVTITDPHKPYVDEVTWEDKAKGGVFRRVREVIDVWYDSGSMPFAQFHYPFENQEKFKASFPAEYIAEGPDQIRLWFYTMHILGVALFDQIPYRNVVTFGMLLDETGKKMSKSQRNYEPLDKVLDEYGGDVLRYFILTSPIVAGNDTIFSVEYLKQARRDFFLTLWNSVKYFVSSATAANFAPVNSTSTEKSSNVLDTWILLRLEETVTAVSAGLDTYQILAATKELPRFVSDLSTWYIRRSRDRFREGDPAALQTLYLVLTTFTKLIAPMFPFLAETLYQTLEMSAQNGQPSVHLCEYPKVNVEILKTSESNEILEKMSQTREVVTKALAARTEAKIKVRQPLSKLTVPSAYNFFSELVKDEVNVEEVVASSEAAEVTLDLVITPELRIKGTARELTRAIQDARKEAGLTPSDKVSATFLDTPENTAAVAKFGDEIKRKVLAETLTAGALTKVEKVA